MKRRITLALACVAIVGCQHQAPKPAPQPAPAPAPDTTAATPTQPAPDTTVHGWSAGNLAVGNAVMIIRARYGGRVYVGAGDSSHTIALTFDANDVDQFVQDARALLPPHPVTNEPAPILTEPGSSRALSFSRIHHGKTTTYHFYFADEALRGFPIPATLVESKAVLTALARGAQIAHEATPKPDSGR
jgi:hypothetical protein